MCLFYKQNMHTRTKQSLFNHLQLRSYKLKFKILKLIPKIWKDVISVQCSLNNRFLKKISRLAYLSCNFVPLNFLKITMHATLCHFLFMDVIRFIDHRFARAFFRQSNAYSIWVFFFQGSDKGFQEEPIQKRLWSCTIKNTTNS